MGIIQPKRFANGGGIREKAYMTGGYKDKKPL